MISGFGQLLTTPGVELDEQSRQEINAGVIENTNQDISFDIQMAQDTKALEITTNRKAVTRTWAFCWRMQSLSLSVLSSWKITVKEPVWCWILPTPLAHALSFRCP